MWPCLKLAATQVTPFDNMFGLHKFELKETVAISVSRSVHSSWYPGSLAATQQPVPAHSPQRRHRSPGPMLAGEPMLAAPTPEARARRLWRARHARQPPPRPRDRASLRCASATPACPLVATLCRR